MPPKGKKKSHKGGHRRFTSGYDLAMQAEKARREQEWRSKKGIESDDEEDENEGNSEDKLKKHNKPHKKNEDEVESEEEEDDDEETEEDSESEEEDEEQEDKPKGVSHLIEIENPNRQKPKTKKIDQINVNQQPTLSRREREELERQQAKDRYQKLHEAGKTEEARADLARLALIRKQREEAAKKREQEKKIAETTKSAAEQKLMEKKKTQA